MESRKSTEKLADYLFGLSKLTYAGIVIGMFAGILSGNIQLAMSEELLIGVIILIIGTIILVTMAVAAHSLLKDEEEKQ